MELITETDNIFELSDDEILYVAANFYDTVKNDEYFKRRLSHIKKHYIKQADNFILVKKARLNNDAITNN